MTTYKSSPLEALFEAQLQKAGVSYLKEVPNPYHTSERKFRYDFYAWWIDKEKGLRACYIEIQGGHGRHGHGTVAGRMRDAEKLALCNFAGQDLFHFVGNQVKSGFALNVTLSYLLRQPPPHDLLCKPSKRKSRTRRKKR